MTLGRKDRRDRMALLLASRAKVAAAVVSTDVQFSVPGRRGHVVLNSGEVVPIRYAVVEAAWLITSHAGPYYARDARYPAEAQPRDYGAEPELQRAVERRAAALDPWQLLTDSVLPVDGPPIVRADGVVVSGNGRTQSIRLALARGLYGGVAEGIVERAAHLHLDLAELARMREPVLVRMMEADVRDSHTLARYGIEMNRDPGQGMSTSETAVGLARLITPAVIDRLARIVAELPDGYRLREFLRLRAREVAEVLDSGGLIDPRKRAAYFTGDGDLTEAAKDLVETSLAGLTVTSGDVLRHASRATRERLVRAGIEFLKLRSVGREWDITEYNSLAVELVTRAEDNACYLRSLRKPKGEPDAGSLVERLVHPGNFANAPATIEDNSYEGTHPAVEALALSLEQSPREYVARVSAYASRAVGAWRSMFECMSPPDAFTATIGTFYCCGGLQVLRVPEAQWFTLPRK